MLTQNNEALSHQSIALHNKGFAVEISSTVLLSVLCAHCNVLLKYLFVGQAFVQNKNVWNAHYVENFYFEQEFCKKHERQARFATINVYGRLETVNVSYDWSRLSFCQNDGTHKTRKILT